MRRKIIKQGLGGYTVSLPISWVREQGLKARDDILIEEQKGNLIISVSEIKQNKPKKIKLEIGDTRESAIRTLIVNAYRAGFDHITFHFLGSEKKIFTIVETFLLGFDCHVQEKGIFLISSVAEPSIDNFEVMIQRQFYILATILKEVFEKPLEREVHRMQRYDNFLKRGITKKRFSASPQLWQLLSMLNQVGRIVYHFQRTVKKEKLAIDKQTKEIFLELYNMCILLQTAYLKKDTSQLYQLDELDQKMH